MAFVEVKTPLSAAAGAQAPPESQQVTAAAAETAGTTPRGSVVVGSLVAILVAWVVSGAINRGSRPAALVVPAGIGLFAMLYAVTQGLERLLEPFSAFFYGTKEHTANRDVALAAAMNVQSAATRPELKSRLRQLGVALEGVQGTRNWFRNPTAVSAGQVREDMAVLLREMVPSRQIRIAMTGPPPTTIRPLPGRPPTATPPIPANEQPVGHDGQRVRELRALVKQDPKAAATDVAADLLAVAQAELN